MTIGGTKRLFQALLVGAALGMPTIVHGASAWVLVDSDNDTLSVIEGDHVLYKFHDIAVGRGGVSMYRRSGDGKTPKGVFYVSWINPDSQYRLFFGLDYPSPSHAEEALRHRVIDGATFRRIRDARERRELPPQDTALGGYIGIHGTGSRDPEVNRLFDWTQGCVALTNEQLDRLIPWVDLGTMVVIR